MFPCSRTKITKPLRMRDLFLLLLLIFNLFYFVHLCGYFIFCHMLVKGNFPIVIARLAFVICCIRNLHLFPGLCSIHQTLHSEIVETMIRNFTSFILSFQQFHHFRENVVGRLTGGKSMGVV